MLRVGVTPLKKLKYLNFAGNQIAIDALADTLLFPSTLEEVIFSDIIYSEKLFDSLKSLKHLRKLNFNGMKLKPPDLEALASMLSSFPLLEDLVLANMDVAHINCEIILIAIKSLKNVKKLDLSGMKLLSGQALGEMLLSLSSLEELVLSHMVIADLEYDTIYSAINSLKNIKKLHLDGLKVVSERAFWEMFLSLSLLEELKFPHVTVDRDDSMNAFCTALASMKGLKYLELPPSMNKSTFLEALSRVLPSLKSLERVVLSAFNLDTDSQKLLFSTLRSLSSLTELDLKRTSTAKTGTLALAGALLSLPLLEKLVMGWIDADDDSQEQVFTAVGSLRYLKELDLRED